MEEGIKEPRGTPRQMTLDWMMAYGYGKLKEEAQQREEWLRRTLKRAIAYKGGAENQKIGLCLSF